MDGCFKERVFCSWGPKSSKHTLFETGPKKVQELYKELCEELFQELHLELYTEPCEELYKELMDGCFKERAFCSFWGPKSEKHTFFETGPQKWTAVLLQFLGANNLKTHVL